MRHASIVIGAVIVAGSWYGLLSGGNDGQLINFHKIFISFGGLITGLSMIGIGFISGAVSSIQRSTEVDPRIDASDEDRQEKPVDWRSILNPFSR